LESFSKNSKNLFPFFDQQPACAGCGQVSFGASKANFFSFGASKGNTTHDFLKSFTRLYQY